MDRYRTTDMAQFGGLMGRFPNVRGPTFVLCLASVGLPGLNNFVSEMLMMAGLFDARNPGVHRLGPGGGRGGRHLPERVVHVHDAPAGVLQPAEGAAGRRPRHAARRT